VLVIFSLSSISTQMNVLETRKMENLTFKATQWQQKKNISAHLIARRQSYLVLIVFISFNYLSKHFCFRELHVLVQSDSVGKWKEFDKKLQKNFHLSSRKKRFWHVAHSKSIESVNHGVNKFQKEQKSLARKMNMTAIFWFFLFVTSSVCELFM